MPVCSCQNHTSSGSVVMFGLLTAKNFIQGPTSVQQQHFTAECKQSLRVRDTQDAHTRTHTRTPLIPSVFYECVSLLCLHAKSSLIRSFGGSEQVGTFHLNLSCHTQGWRDHIYGDTQVKSLYGALTLSLETDRRLRGRRSPVRARSITD